MVPSSRVCPPIAQAGCSEFALPSFLPSGSNDMDLSSKTRTGDSYWLSMKVVGIKGPGP